MTTRTRSTRRRLGQQFCTTDRRPRKGRQAGAYLKQGALDPQPNRQNTSSDGSGSADFNDPSGDDYGTVDK
jgi:hypothetical protein